MSFKSVGSPMGMGCVRLRRPRSDTDWVWVAEKRRVWRDLGRCERRADNVREKPISRILSASSRTVRMEVRQHEHGKMA